MNRKNSNMDGFVLRRRSQNSDMSQQRPSLTPRTIPERFLIDPAKGGERPAAPRQHAAPALVRTAGPANHGMSKPMELPNPSREKLSLNLDLDEPAGKTGKKAKQKKDKKQKVRKKWSRKKIALTIVGLVLATVIAFAGYFAYKFLTTGGKIFKGNVIQALFDPGQPLKQDANGRSNILLFGTSEDDPGHDAPDLTDSIMVVSVDQKKQDAYIVSLPRDFHVQYGRACVTGYQGKLNVLYSCGKSEGGEDGGSKALREKVGEVLGLDVQYSAHVNYTVLRQAVQAVGGIRINIESVDPRGQMDSNFDWKCGVGDYKVSRAEVLRRCPPNGHFIDYKIGPVDLDAEHALYLAQARGDGALTYGFPRSNPDRQDNQRKILIALKDKAASAGVLANPVAVNNLLDAVGDNLRTNFEANEIKTLVRLGKDVKSQDIMSFSLEDSAHPLATANCFSGNRCPNAGSFNYSAIQAAITSLSTGDKAKFEYAKVDVLNASGTPGLAQSQADKISAKLTVSNVGNAPEALGAKPISFYDMTDGKKPATLQALKTLLGVEVTAGKPAGVTSTADFVVIVGKQPEPTTQNQ